MSRKINDRGVDINRQLRPGRQQLSREEVRTHQRDRIVGALETAMSANGYLDTSVADIIKIAQVSRQTFYELFTSKQDCFLASYALRQQALVDHVLATPSVQSPMERFATLLRNYLAVMSSDPGLSRLYLVGVYTAGSDAVAARLEMQQQFVDAISIVFRVQTTQEHFVCRALVSAISTMVTHALIEADAQAVLDLYEPLMHTTGLLMAPSVESVGAGGE